jgi:hypothetical protein
MNKLCSANHLHALDKFHLSFFFRAFAFASSQQLANINAVQRPHPAEGATTGEAVSVHAFAGTSFALRHPVHPTL